MKIDVKKQYKIDGASFDRKTTNGIKNYFSRSSLNKEFSQKRLGYYVVSLASISTSVYGGVVMGTLIFIMAASLIETIKLIMSRDHKFSVILASIISLSFALYGLFMTIDTENQGQTNSKDQVLALKDAIVSADKQIESLQRAPVVSTVSQNAITFDAASYNALIVELSDKKAKLDVLKTERHTYWQRVPSRRNKRTGAWMLNHPSKCTGSYCSKLQSKQAKVNSLQQQKRAMDDEKNQLLDHQKSAILMEGKKTVAAQKKLATIRELIENRNKYQQKLLDLQGDVKVPVNIGFTMFLLFMLLVFVELFQYTIGNRIEELGNHRMMVNMLYSNYLTKKAIQDEAMKKPEENVVKSGFFSKKQVVVSNIATTKKVDNTIDLTPEAKRIRKILRGAGCTELAITGKLAVVHMNILMKNRNLLKELHTLKKDDETTRAALNRLLLSWSVTTRRWRGKELSAEFKRGMRK